MLGNRFLHNSLHLINFLVALLGERGVMGGVDCPVVAQQRSSVRQAPIRNVASVPSSCQAPRMGCLRNISPLRDNTFKPSPLPCGSRNTAQTSQWHTQGRCFALILLISLMYAYQLYAGSP